MRAAPVTSGVLLLCFMMIFNTCPPGGEAQPFIKCHTENGPSPEWKMLHTFTPADLSNLTAEIIETHGTCLLNITWTIAADASIRFLNATKICVMTFGNPTCIRCDYTEEFPNQLDSNNRNWQFHFVGFPVEEDTDYFIDAFNLPPANPNSDDPRQRIDLTSPSCEHNVLKHCGTCIKKGSLWDPDITVCYMESEIQVNFTSSVLTSSYSILFCESYECHDPTFHDVYTNKTGARISETIPVSDGNSRIFIELIPYFPRCQYDCRRIPHHQLCSDETSTNSGLIYIGIVLPFLIICTVAAVLYFKRKHGSVRSWTYFPHRVQQIPAAVLIVYSQEVCFQHTVLAFAEFLHKSCQSSVIIDAWQKRKIAEVGPVQWLATQKEIADKIIFLSPSDTNPACDSNCIRMIESHRKDTDHMFTLAFNLFCSDWKKQASLHKYMVVSFSETSSVKNLPSPLDICPKYFLMKDIDLFWQDLSFSLHKSEGTKLNPSWLKCRT